MCTNRDSTSCFEAISMRASRRLKACTTYFFSEWYDGKHGFHTTFENGILFNKEAGETGHWFDEPIKTLISGVSDCSLGFGNDGFVQSPSKMSEGQSSSDKAVEVST